MVESLSPPAGSWQVACRAAYYKLQECRECRGYTTAIERAKGFEDRLPEVCPNVTLVETQPGDWNREKSQKVMEAFLVKYDDIDGVYAGDDNMGVGALNAAKAAGREGIIFVGATNFSVGYEAMERGGHENAAVVVMQLGDAESL